MDKVYRITDVECLDCWYGFIYTANNSPYKLKETIRPTLEGLEVVWPATDDGDIEFSIEAGGDHVVILKRTEGSCRYGLQYLTHPRELSDEEMKQHAKDLPDDEAANFGNTRAFYKLFNTA